MAEYQPWTDRQTFYIALLVAAAVLLWELLPFARAWITPYTFAILCTPLWLNVLFAEAHSSARRAYLTLALRGSILALVAALLLILQARTNLTRLAAPHNASHSPHGGAPYRYADTHARRYTYPDDEERQPAARTIPRPSARTPRPPPVPS